MQCFDAERENKKEIIREKNKKEKKKTYRFLLYRMVRRCQVYFKIKKK